MCLRWAAILLIASFLPAQAPKKDEAPVVTKHELQLGGRALRYTATTGFLPFLSDSGDLEASMFHVAYTLDTQIPKSQRPLTFVFNGGPGAGSLWLHLGAVGPKRVKMLDDGNLPPPPYELVDNPHTWLEQTDLVFIDPIGTGFSRPAKPELGKKFWGVQQDLDSVGTFIRRYLSRVERFSSPLFLAGESYGTTRAAGLSGWLVDKGIALNGVVLISTVLNFQTLRPAPGNDTPYPLLLPTFTATAWYHKKLPPDLQNSDLQKAVREAREFAQNGYPLALAKGDRLTGPERQAVVDKLARLTGLEKRYLDLADLRVDVQHFTKELLRGEKHTVGRLDSRIKGVESNGIGETAQADPSMTAIRPPYTSLMNDYARTELGFKTDLEYYALGGGIATAWDFGSASNGYADTSGGLRAAFQRNPYMRVLVASGYYDMATPFFATEYTVAHLGLDAKSRSQVTMHEYEAGHMMYIHKPSLEKLRRDVSAFYEAALKR